MEATTSYNAIIVDSDAGSRMRLKQTTTVVSAFGHVMQLPFLNQAMARLQSDEPCDVIFISSSFEQEEIAAFINQGKQTKQGQLAAYVLTLKVGDQDTATVAKTVLYGADGFLCEPFSVDNVVEITHLSARVKKERAAAREKFAITLLVDDIMAQIDEIATFLTNLLDVGGLMKKFRVKCSVLRSMKPESLEVYHETFVEKLEKTPVPRPRRPELQGKLYRGSSERVKKKLGEKLSASAKDNSDTQT